MNNDAPSIRSLVQDCKQGDISSKEKMYRTFYGYIMGVIIRYVPVTDDAEELVNDTFMKIFKHISSFDGPGDQEAYGKLFRGWIAKIGSRTAIDHIRKQKNNFNTSEIDKVQTHIVATPISMDMEVADIMQLLDQLPATHKIVFNMYEVEGYSHDEISKLLNIPVSSSRVFLTRAKSKLRSLYELKFSEC